MRYAKVVALLPIDRRLAAKREGEGPETLVDFGPESQVYTYGIPPSQRGQIVPGQVVWVPFGRQRQQGVVMALAEQPPEGIDIKPIDEPVMIEPALNARSD